MTKIFTLLLFVSVSMGASAFAGSLSGQDAIDMTNILSDAGVKPTPGKSMIQAFDMICEGHNFQNQCYASTEPTDPATSRVDVKSQSATRFWSLLKTGGLKPFTSNVADGTAGEVLITGASVTCSLTNGKANECAVHAK